MYIYEWRCSQENWRHSFYYTWQDILPQGKFVFLVMKKMNKEIV